MDTKTAALALIAALALTGCEQAADDHADHDHDHAETTDTMEEAVEEAGEAVEEAAEEAGDAMEEAAEEAGSAIEEGVDAVTGGG